MVLEYNLLKRYKDLFLFEDDLFRDGMRRVPEQIY